MLLPPDPASAAECHPGCWCGWASVNTFTLGNLILGLYLRHLACPMPPPLLADRPRIGRPLKAVNMCWWVLWDIIIANIRSPA